MSDKPNPLMALDVPQLLCTWHNKPFAAKWPQGYLTYSMEAFQRILNEESIQTAALHDVGNVPGLLKKKPACCRLGRDKLLQLYYDVHKLCNEHGSDSPWCLDICDWCKLAGIGGPMTFPMWQGHETFTHLCFPCLLDCVHVDGRMN